MKDNAERCLFCGEIIPEGAQVCADCMKLHGGEAEEVQKITEELRDIAGVLSITANTDGNIKQSMESILRIADRLERKKNEESRRTKIFAAGSVGKIKDSDKL